MFDKNEVLENIKEYVVEPFAPVLVRNLSWFTKVHEVMTSYVMDIYIIRIVFICNNPKNYFI